MSRRVLIELQFSGAIPYYILLSRHDEVVFEQHENFPKATFRNRCHLAGPDGLLRLTVPIMHGRSHRQLMKDTRIAYDHDWRKQHWKSLEAAYRRSPYFEYFEDELAEIYSRQPVFLIDLNLQIHEFVEHALGWSIPFTTSAEYEEHPNATDMRSTISPTQSPDVKLSELRYHQVFEERHGFIPNLSILDLLFNEGPSTGGLIRRLRDLPVQST